MKCLALIAIGFLAFSFSACQQHSAQELLLIKMPGEQVVPPGQKNEAGEPAKPGDQSKPAPGYF